MDEINSTPAAAVPATDVAHPNTKRRSEKYKDFALGGTAVVTLSTVTWLITQAVTPINRDITRLDGAIMGNRTEVMAGINEIKSEIRQIRVDTDKNFDRMFTVFREDKAAQYRIDSGQDDRIRELAAKADLVKRRNVN